MVRWTAGLMEGGMEERMDDWDCQGQGEVKRHGRV